MSPDVTWSSFLYLLKYNFHLLSVPWLKSRVLLGGWVGTVLSLFASAKKEKIKLLSKLDVVLSFKQCIFTAKKLTMISIYSYNKNILYKHVLLPPPPSSSPLRWSIPVFSIDRVMVLTWTEWNQKEHLAVFFSPRITVHVWPVNMTGKWIFGPVKSPF